ncbi:MAG: TFIIB-type zinc ribbon-containing protein [Acidilobaceae archaeon]|nr:TFIIB-type zinc ribbon-containing protein [Acidilobaceae archaeon]
MICRYCGSDNIVWDHASGFVVCASCGSVLQVMMEHQASGSEPSRKRYGRPQEREVPREAWGMDEVVNRRAMNALKVKEVRELLELINKNPLLKARTFRVKVAIAAYLYYRALGLSKRKSMKKASEMAGVPQRTIDKVKARHGSLLAAAELRARALLGS